jgi:hypothetical protein
VFTEINPSTGLHVPLNAVPLGGSCGGLQAWNQRSRTSLDCFSKTESGTPNPTEVASFPSSSFIMFGPEVKGRLLWTGDRGLVDPSDSIERRLSKVFHSSVTELERRISNTCMGVVSSPGDVGRNRQ